MRRVATVLPAVLVALAITVASASSSRAEPAAPTFQQHLDAKAPPVVTLRFDLKIRIGFQGESMEFERKTEAAAAVVDPSGIVLASNIELGGDSGGYLKAMFGSFLPGATFSASPANIRVVVAGEETEREAVLVARDSDLGVAILQILDLKDVRLASVDLGKAGAFRPGQTLFGVSRRSRAFDNAPYLAFLYASQRVEKPRPMWGVLGEFGEEGLPVYDVAGLPVGVLVKQTGGDTGENTDSLSFGTFLVPADAVVRSLDAARKRIPEAVAKSRSDK